VVPLGVEILGEFQAVGGTEIDAKGTALADLGADEHRPFAWAV
jgi:hypothetical protein